MIAAQPRLAVLSGPSGAGKSTVVRQLLDHCPLPLRLSVSVTTRPPRPGEVNGTDYFFVSDQEFQQRRKAGEFLEYKEVFSHGHWYGTLHSQVASGLEQGEWVILEIDVQGAMMVLDKKPDVVTFFLHPGSMEELERRLRSRGTEPEQSIQRRMEVARIEMQMLDRYQYEVVNEDPVEAAAEICQHLTRLANAPTKS